MLGASNQLPWLQGLMPAMSAMPTLLTISAFAAATALACTAITASAAPAADAMLVLKPAQVQSLGLQTTTIAAEAAGIAARYPATVLVPSNQQRVLAAPLPALVEALRASVGDTVRAGQVLAVLRSAQVQELHHDVHVARSNATLAAGQMARDEQLYKEGLIARSRLDTTRSQAHLANEQREERELALAQAGGSAQGDSSRITLTAPISGVVLERPVVVGQRVDPATALYRLANLSPLWLEMQVPAREAQAVRPGDEVRWVGGEAVGKVIAIGHAVDPATQTVLVRAEVKQPPPSLRAGQAVEVALQRTAVGLSPVPSAAVVDDGGRSIVFVDSGEGRYQALPVQAVSSAGGITAVRGLPAGSKVVVQGTAALKSLRSAQRP
jgi:RND family efflux transporter MFP subunit